MDNDDLSEGLCYCRARGCLVSRAFCTREGPHEQHVAATGLELLAQEMRQACREFDEAMAPWAA